MQVCGRQVGRRGVRLSGCGVTCTHVCKLHSVLPSVRLLFQAGWLNFSKASNTLAVPACSGAGNEQTGDPKPAASISQPGVVQLTSTHTITGLAQQQLPRTVLGRPHTNPENSTLNAQQTHKSCTNTRHNPYHHPTSYDNPRVLDRRLLRLTCCCCDSSCHQHTPWCCCLDCPCCHGCGCCSCCCLVCRPG